jgi:hypothetical protein
VCEALGKAQHITQHDVNMLLNQRPGKLQIKDIKASGPVHSCCGMVAKCIATTTFTGSGPRLTALSRATLGS